ncbi:MAG: tetratricopeptide repeat protein, partial [bacterium]
EPESRAAQLEHGAILAEEGGVDEAVAAYDRATALDPLDPEAAFRAATLLRDTGRIEEARDRLAGLLERHPWHGGAALVLARLELERDPASEQALILSRQAARFSRAAGPESFELLARVLLDREEPEEAVVALDRARRKGLLTATARYRLALALMAVGDEKAARRELRAALQAPDFEERKAARAHLEALDGSEATSG